jgi:cell division septal protein FtsQ
MASVERHGWRRGRWVLLGCLIAGVGAAAFLLTRSSIFSISAIEIVGERRLTEASILSASGLREGGSALAADLAAAEERIAALQGVADAQVARAGVGVLITVVERRPALEVRLGGLQWLLDEHGALVDTAGSPHARVPVLIVTGPDPVVGMEPPVDAGTVERALTLWRALPIGVDQIMLDADGGVSFQLGAVDIRFGDLDRVQDKMRAIALVQRRARADGARLLVLDVSAPSRPAAHVV